MITHEFRRVGHHLGTAITLSAAGAHSVQADRFFDRIAELEAVLSRFRPDSQLSRVADGRLDADDADPALREVLARCAVLRHLTDGAFDHEPRRMDPAAPRLDPNAFAKGWIVEEAAMCLKLAGVDRFFVNAGGDVLIGGAPPSDPYRVGVRHPDDVRSVVAVLEVATGAVATSGTYERGHHIRSGSEVDQRLRSVTVTGPDLADADALATAVFAAGLEEPSWWRRVDGAFGLLTVAASGRLRWTPPADRSASRMCLRQPRPPGAQRPRETSR